MSTTTTAITTIAMKRSMSNKEIPVIELFGPTVQGEGAITGQVSYFLRTGGCGHRCSWCDSMHAVDPEQIKQNKTMMTQQQIAEWLHQHVPEKPAGTWLTLSGGDPVMWNLIDLVNAASLWGMRINVETQGALWKPWLLNCDLVTCSPKGPSSGMADKLNWKILEEYYLKLHHKRYPSMNQLVFKSVVFNEEDLNFAEEIHRRYPNVEYYLSVGTPPQMTSTYALESVVIDRYRWLVRKVLERPSLFDCIVGPQMHVLLWGHEKGK